MKKAEAAIGVAAAVGLAGLIAYVYKKGVVMRKSYGDAPAPATSGPISQAGPPPSQAHSTMPKGGLIGIIGKLPKKPSAHPTTKPYYPNVGPSYAPAYPYDPNAQLVDDLSQQNAELQAQMLEMQEAQLADIEQNLQQGGAGYGDAQADDLMQLTSLIGQLTQSGDAGDAVDEYEESVHDFVDDDHLDGDEGP